MSEQIFELAFYGKLVEGAELQQTKEQVAQLFKAGVEQVERMFTGSRVVIRNKLDEETARKYLIALKKRGADCQIERMGQPGIAVNLDAPAASSPVSSPASEPVSAAAPAPETARPSSAQEVPSPAVKKTASAKPGMSVTGLPIVGERVDDILSDKHFDLAPVGTRLEDKKEEVHPDLHALDDVTLAPVGSELVEHREQPPVSVPDVSHLKLEPDEKHR